MGSVISLPVVAVTALGTVYAGSSPPSDIANSASIIQDNGMWLLDRTDIENKVSKIYLCASKSSYCACYMNDTVFHYYVKSSAVYYVNNLTKKLTTPYIEYNSREVDEVLFHGYFTISSAIILSYTLNPIIQAALYNSEEECLRALGLLENPITYRLTNCTAPNAPSEAKVGDTVVVPFVFGEGYGIVNDANVFVANNGVVIPSTYADGILTFTMPDPN